MSTTTTPADLLLSSGPTDARLRDLWTPTEREHLRELTLARTGSAYTGRGLRTRRRVGIFAGATAAGAAAILTGPAILAPSQTPQAAALTRLAGTANSRPAVVIPPGKFLHMTVVAHDRTYATTSNSWTDQAGNIWRKDVSGTGQVDYYLFPHPDHQSVDYPSPAYARTLPTDPAELEAYLRARVDGSTTQDEAVFTAIGAMLRLGYVPAPVRATAIKTLARLPEVTTSTATTLNHRTALRVDFIDKRHRPGAVASLFFDPQTSALVQESNTYPGHPGQTYTALTTLDAVVGSVPRAVRRNAVTMHE
jgi:hypothetical protein